MWIYGSGFPKSLDISKAIDKAAGKEREVSGKRKHPTLRDSSLVEEQANAFHGSNAWKREWDITKPASNLAKQWDGWGTALKPAHEPVCLARKPLSESTVAKNVEVWETGGLNIDACRVPGEPTPINKLKSWSGFGQEKQPDYVQEINNKGRFPANLIHDGSETIQSEFEPYGITKSGKVTEDKAEYSHSSKTTNLISGVTNSTNQHGDSGLVSRFFYCAKVSTKERGEGNDHPTVKPISLMRYLVKLVTLKGGVVLDPFMGSGTTEIACVLEGMRFVGIEKDEKYFDIAVRRIEEVLHNRKQSLEEYMV